MTFTASNACFGCNLPVNFHLNLPLQSRQTPVWKEIKTSGTPFFGWSVPFKITLLPKSYPIRSQPGAPTKVPLCPVGVWWVEKHHRLDQASSQAVVMPCTAIMALSCNDLGEFSSITWNNPEPTHQFSTSVKTYIINIYIYKNLYTYWY